MEIKYKPPRFDPFLVFNPTKGLIQSIIKELKGRAYAAQRQKLRAETKLGYIPDWLSTRHTGLNTRIKYLSDRLRGWTKEYGWDQHGGRGVTEEDIRRAKEVSIETLYDGRLRRRGRTMVGVCPFHTERTGSFTVYSDRNIWRCFGCNSFGDSIDFIVSRDQISFVDAVKLLIS